MNGEAAGHVLTVFNAADVPEATQRAVMVLLAPYEPDIYSRDLDAKGFAL